MLSPETRVAAPVLRRRAILRTCGGSQHPNLFLGLGVIGLVSNHIDDGAPGALLGPCHQLFQLLLAARPMRPQRGDLIAAVVVECARVGEDVSLSLLVAEHADNAIPPVIRGRRWRSSAQRAWTVIQRCCLACARTISIQDSTQQEVFS